MVSAIAATAEGCNGLGAGLPQFVRDQFDAFLECGILAHGFLRLRCGECGHDKLVAFSLPSAVAFAPRARPGARRSRRPTWWSTSSRRWARLLKRVSDIDMQYCPNCGARELKIIAAILERPVIEMILAHLGLDPQPPVALRTVSASHGQHQGQP